EHAARSVEGGVKVAHADGGAVLLQHLRGESVPDAISGVPLRLFERLGRTPSLEYPTPGVIDHIDRSEVAVRQARPRVKQVKLHGSPAPSRSGRRLGAVVGVGLILGPW